MISELINIVYSIPWADPRIGGHLPWEEIFAMYKLLSNLLQPLMNGHLLALYPFESHSGLLRTAFHMSKISPAFSRRSPIAW